VATDASLHDAAWVATRTAEQLQSRHRVHAARGARAGLGAARETAAAIAGSASVVMAPKIQFSLWRRSSRANAAKLQALGLGRMETSIAVAAARRGCIYITISEAWSSRTCAHCGHEPERGPSGRTYACANPPSCAWCCHRDVGNPQPNMLRHAALLGLRTLLLLLREGEQGDDEGQDDDAAVGVAVAADPLRRLPGAVAAAVRAGLGLDRREGVG